MSLESQELFTEEWLDQWRRKAIAGSVSAELQDRFGFEDFYSPAEVIEVCEARNVVGPSRVCALAMFVESGQLGDLLNDYGISEPAEEWRKIMSRKLSSGGGAE